MKTCWQPLMLDALEALDVRENPHGIYGIREAYSVNGRLPKLAHLFSWSGKTNILRCLGVRGVQSRFESDEMRFKTEVGETVFVQVLDWATTKVRHYGSAYRLDEHHGKAPQAPKWDLETLVPKLPSRSGRDYTHGILLLAYYASEKDSEVFIGRSASPDFLNRYEVAHFSREWEDRYRRAFRTAVHLWTPHAISARSEP